MNIYDEETLLYFKLKNLLEFESYTGNEMIAVSIDSQSLFATISNTIEFLEKIKPEIKYLYNTP